ncbi:hypothetical protein CCHR01_06308 [Colletotrichum chrysophilum]|uniref:Uncharacterized protein n=1 Tax=Colletotrichum chrysophilum TaxID=1836956 RepID=A0AAD9AR12_9PEZI|nr:hypothetical protein CCHR01_06308 [Colletotrichum chrysophilum]
MRSSAETAQIDWYNCEDSHRDVNTPAQANIAALDVDCADIPSKPKMKLFAVLAAIALSAGVVMASLNPIDTSVEVPGLLDARQDGTCCDCPDGHRACGGACYKEPKCS